MPENQNIEWKESWRDEYLKWICSFANTGGGTIFIGKDDNGKVIHLADSKRLMEDIPNKIRNHLGIVCELYLRDENGKDYIEVIVPPYSVAVSLRGRFYTRTGSTTTELSGNALAEFLLKKSGKTWDDVIEETATLNDIDEASLQLFIKDAERSGRMPAVEELSTMELLEKLRLGKNGKLKRAAIVLFGKDPNNFYPNIMVKVGRFGKDDTDLLSQEVLEGNLIQLLKQLPELLNNKFLLKKIRFEGMQRIESDVYPLAALREMILNALVHRTYMGAPIQLRVYENKLSLWNEGALPEGLSSESLKRNHNSYPRNPFIADVCFKAGYIDSWGRGTIKIIDSCRDAHLPEPYINEMDGGMMTVLFSEATHETTPQVTLQATPQVTLQVESLIKLLETEQTRAEIQEKLKLSDRKNFTDNYLKPALEKGLIEMTMPEKPQSGNQKYRLTELGKQLKKK